MKSLLVWALIVAWLPAAASAQGLTANITNDATGVQCTSWKITEDRRDYANGTLSVALAGFPTTEIRDAGKQPSCTERYSFGRDEWPKGKALDAVTLDDLYAMVMVKAPPPRMTVNSDPGNGPIGPRMVADPPKFKDATLTK